MGRLTWKKPNGEWGLANGSLQDVPREYYGCICKLKDYEETGLSPDQLTMISELYLEKCLEVNKLRAQLAAVRRGEVLK